MGLVAVLLLGGAVWLFMRGGAQKKGTDDFPDGVVLLCSSCQHGFAISISDMGNWINQGTGTSYPCEKCKKNTSDRAHRCSNSDCRQFFLKYIDINGKLGCPICKKPVKG